MKHRWISLLLLVCLAGGLASCVNRRNSESFYFGNYSEAEALFKRGDYDRAIQKYQAYIDENPEGNLALISRYYIGRSHAALGHLEEARKIFQTIVNQNADTVWGNFSETQLKELEKATAASPGKS